MQTNRLLSLAAALAGLTCASCVPQPAAPPPPAAVAPPPAAVAGGVPPQLQPPPSAVPLVRANARGVQIYTCTEKPGAGFAWNFKAPDAMLVDPTGRPVAKHFAGPTWQAMDGSMAVGEAVANVPAPGGQGVPWLLLRAKAHQGAGMFADVSFVQRLDTNGGLAPAGGCDPAHAGQEARIPYTAVYVLYR